jgi:hypothetical protein
MSSSPTSDQSADGPAGHLSEDSSQNGDSVSRKETVVHYSRVSDCSRNRIMFWKMTFVMLQEELVRISKLPAANVRPAFLKAECNNE